MKYFLPIRIFLYTILCALLVNPTMVVAQSEKAIAPKVDLKQEPKYIVIDLSNGSEASFYPVSHLLSAPVAGWTDEYKSNKLALRRIEAGSFIMGSPDDELGRKFDEDLHQVTLTKPYYIGVFKLTQRQWELVMGNDPSTLSGFFRPVQNVPYDYFRGVVKGARWPLNAEVDATSIMGILRAKTSLEFDLPTEAQWEYACRAGTTTALNSGKNLLSIPSCFNMNEVGRYAYNQLDGKGGYLLGPTTVGCYRPNAWGLYDMHGNGWEWCLDWYTASLGTEPVIDPVGATSGTSRLVRGGGNPYHVQDCRSASRSKHFPLFQTFYIGVRVIVRLEE